MRVRKRTCYKSCIFALRSRRWALGGDGQHAIQMDPKAKKEGSIPQRTKREPVFEPEENSGFEASLLPKVGVGEERANW